ncbi:hypothetical protein D3C71_1881460 [compost metagenome]
MAILLTQRFNMLHFTCRQQIPINLVYASFTANGFGRCVMVSCKHGRLYTKLVQPCNSFPGLWTNVVS